MAGHRNAKTPPRLPRHQVRADRNRRRLTAATTAEEQLAAAYDWFRMAARHMADAGERGRRMRTVAQVLTREAAEIDGMPR